MVADHQEEAVVVVAVLDVAEEGGAMEVGEEDAAEVVMAEEAEEV